MAFLLNPYNDPNVPTKAIMYEMERASYRSPQDDFKPNVPGWVDVFKTPTLHIFKPLTDGGDVFVVAIRGTADFTDFKAWLPTVWNGLEGTNRWTKDYNDLTQFQETYPPSKYTYYGVAHSLGGEILDQFIKKGMIQSGISYNPAIQTSDISDADLAKKNYRIYASGDPLYKLMGKWNHPSEVRPSPTSWYDMFKPFILDAYSGYKQHILANPLFVGGAVPTDEALYEKAKSIVYPRYDKPSAYRSGALMKKYKELGGEFKDEPDGERELARWYKENWADVGNKSYPVFRPTKRVNEDTPKTVQEIPPERLKELIALKQKIKGKKNLPPF